MARRRKKRRGPPGTPGESGGEGAPEPSAPKAPERINNPFADALRDVKPARKGAQRQAATPKPASSPSASRTEQRAARGTAQDGSRKGEDRGHAAQSQDASRGRETSTPYSWEDRVAFQQAFAGVKPLSRRRTKSVREQMVPSQGGETGAGPRSGQAGGDPSADAEARARLDALVGGGVTFHVHRESDGYVEGLHAHAHPNTLRLAKSDRATVDASLDLHGVRAGDVQREVTRFVRSRQQAGDRIVRIVHGKGHHSEGGRPVLGEQVVRALTEGGAAPVVLAFASAPQRHGGKGALLVCLHPKK